MISVNRRAARIVQQMIDDHLALGLGITRLENGTTVVDAGIQVPGSMEAGRLFACACLGGLGEVSFIQQPLGDPGTGREHGPRYAAAPAPGRRRAASPPRKVLRMRLFIAVTVPDEVRAQLAELQQGMKRLPVDVRWIAPENFHLTLKFLGEVADGLLPGVEAALAAAAAAVPPFTAAFRGAGAFPRPQSPRIVWAGISDGAAELQRLAARVDEECGRLGFGREKRAFSPHLTIGRVRSRQNLPLLVKRIAALADAAAGTFPVTEIVLMRSMLHPAGAEYTVVRSAPLVCPV
jgi:2'-5' RNA ligase